MPAPRPDPAALVRAGLAILGLVAVGARLAAHHLDGEPYLPPALTRPARHALGRRRSTRPSRPRDQEHPDMPPDPAPLATPAVPAAAWQRWAYLPPEGFDPTVAELTRLADTLAAAGSRGGEGASAREAGGDGRGLLAVELRSDRDPSGHARLVYGWHAPPSLLATPPQVWPTLTAAPLADVAAGRLDPNPEPGHDQDRPAARLGRCAARAELTLTGPATEALLVDITDSGDGRGAQTPLTELGRVIAQLHPDAGEYALVSVGLLPLPPAEAEQVRAWAAHTLTPGGPIPSPGRQHKALLIHDGASLWNAQVLLGCWADDPARAEAAVAALATAFAACAGHNRWGMLPGPPTPPPRRHRTGRAAARARAEQAWFDARLLGGRWGPARPMVLTSVELWSLLAPPTRACPAPNVLHAPTPAPPPARRSGRHPASARVTQPDDPGASVLAGILEQFAIAATVTGVTRGPTLTRYQLTLGTGTKVAKLLGLAQDLAVAFGQPDIRMVAPIPGQPGTIGVEIPHPPAERTLVTLDQVLFPTGRTRRDDRSDDRPPLTVAVGADLAGNPVTADLARLPHLLLAGTTGSGKTQWLNALIASLLLRNPPDRVQLVLIDPKRVEFAGWAGVAHLRTPVITHPARAADALEDVVEELDRRLGLLEGARVRTIGAYNTAVAAGALTPTSQPTGQPLPYLVVVVDELADLLLVAGSRVEDAVQRIAQIARAVGIHLVIATQRPSVDVVTGVIKANIPARIAFMVASAADSRVILDTGGADKLIGDGDLLWLPAGTAKPARLQGPFASDRQLAEIADAARRRTPADAAGEAGMEMEGEDGP